MLHLLRLARRTNTTTRSSAAAAAAAHSNTAGTVRSSLRGLYPWAAAGVVGGSAASAVSTGSSSSSSFGGARIGVRAASGTRHTSLPGDPDSASAPPHAPDPVFPGPGPGSSSLAAGGGSSSGSSSGGSPMQQAAAAGDAAHSRGDPRGGDRGAGGVVSQADDPVSQDLASAPLDSPLLEQAQTGIGAGVGGGTSGALAGVVGAVLGGPAVGLAAGALGALSGAAVGGAVAAEREGNQAGDVVQLPAAAGGTAPGSSSGGGGGGGGELPPAEDPARLKAAEKPVVEVSAPPGKEGLGGRPGRRHGDQ